MIYRPMAHSLFPPRFRDDFDRADSATVGNGWTAVPEANWAIVGNLVQRDATVVAGAITRANSVTDGYAECVPKHDLIGPMMRVSLGVGYVAVASADSTVIYRDGGTTSFQTISGRAPNLSTDRLRLEVVGTTFRVFINDELIFQGTDSTHGSAGSQGVQAVDTVAGTARAVDNFEMGS